MDLLLDLLLDLLMDLLLDLLLVFKLSLTFLINCLLTENCSCSIVSSISNIGVSSKYCIILIGN